MRPKTISLTGSGAGVTNSTPVPVNWRTHDIALAFTTDGSTTGFTVEYTLTNPQDYASAAAWNSASVWSDHATIAGETAAADGNIDFPVRGIRLQADANGTDTGTLIIVQGT